MLKTEQETENKVQKLRVDGMLTLRKFIHRLES